MSKVPLLFAMRTLQKSVLVICTASAAACAAMAENGTTVVPTPCEMSVTSGECAAKGEPKFEGVASTPVELHGHILCGQGNNWSDVRPRGGGVDRRQET